MQLIKELRELKEIKISSLSIGNFDGIHLGHQAIIKEVLRFQHSLIVIFDPHPRKVILPHEFSNVITTTKEKKEILEKLGVKNLLILKFTLSLGRMEAEDFVKWLIRDHVRPKEVIIGYNHQFGYNAKGDFELLVHMGKKYGFEVTRVPPVYVRGFPVSSTWIRRTLIKGEVELAGELMGRLYSITSKVIHGKKRGSSLTYPTANLEIPKDKIIPKSGVYAVWVEYKDKKFPGMMHIGEKPTFNEPFGMEVHIIGFNENLLSKSIKIEFVKYIREVQKFKTPKALKNRLEEDKKLVSKFVNIQ
jgi:riboflavin kinase/FMN adenylyltransferase